MQSSYTRMRFKVHYMTLVEVMVASFVLTISLLALLSTATVSRYMVLENRLALEAERRAFDRAQTYANLSIPELEVVVKQINATATKHYIGDFESLKFQNQNQSSSSTFFGPDLNHFEQGKWSLSVKTFRNSFEIRSTVIYRLRALSGKKPTKQYVSVMHRYRSL